MLRKKIKEKETHLHYFPTFGSLKRKVNQSLIRFENMQDEVFRLSGLYNRLPRKKSADLTININLKIEIKKMATD